MQPQVLCQAGGFQGMRVRQQQVRSAVGFPPGTHRTPFQPRNVGYQASRAAVVRGQAGALLALPTRPGLLLAAGGRRLVQGVDGCSVSLSQV